MEKWSEICKYGSEVSTLSTSTRPLAASLASLRSIAFMYSDLLSSQIHVRVQICSASLIRFSSFRFDSISTLLTCFCFTFNRKPSISIVLCILLFSCLNSHLFYTKNSSAEFRPYFLLQFLYFAFPISCVWIGRTSKKLFDLKFNQNFDYKSISQENMHSPFLIIIKNILYSVCKYF